jgi:hypothetical protein
MKRVQMIPILVGVTLLAGSVLSGCAARECHRPGPVAARVVVYPAPIWRPAPPVYVHRPPVARHTPVAPLHRAPAPAYRSLTPRTPAPKPPVIRAPTTPRPMRTYTPKPVFRPPSIRR